MNIDKINFAKLQGLIPVIVQHYQSLEVLMLGFMNQEALLKTIETNRVTFYSRSRKTLWTKGSFSGNFLIVQSINVDCDEDTLLILAAPEGATCHKGTRSCFQLKQKPAISWFFLLEQIICSRIENPMPQSYTCQLLQSGISRMAQKVGEEGVEVALAAVVDGEEKLLNESVDLIYHLFVLLKAKNLSLTQLADKIAERYSN